MYHHSVYISIIIYLSKWQINISTAKLQPIWIWWTSSRLRDMSLSTQPVASPSKTPSSFFFSPYHPVSAIAVVIPGNGVFWPIWTWSVVGFCGHHLHCYVAVHSPLLDGFILWRWCYIYGYVHRVFWWMEWSLTLFNRGFNFCNDTRRLHPSNSYNCSSLQSCATGNFLGSTIQVLILLLTESKLIFLYTMLWSTLVRTKTQRKIQMPNGEIIELLCGARFYTRRESKVTPIAKPLDPFPGVYGVSRGRRGESSQEHE